MIKTSIIEYLGKVDGGILVLIGITYENKYYEGTFFYDPKNILLTVSEDLESIIGDITKHPEYIDILKELLKKVVPYEEMYDRIDEVNFSRWVEGEIEIERDIS